MAVTIRIRRIIPPHKLPLAGPLLDKVRELIHHQNGHLYTEVPEISIENSTWSSLEAWKAWESSRDWQAAKACIEKLLDAKTECVIVPTAGR
ncbi:hypothetical protein [uncultured Desulfosarcina sp.]|uniref:hypothetical protein n=1 Tax=uncultured Desulfosarcina sp. TaxID=218289 RepID=UPI0029C6CC07|nr:hypothetical protein [uncultured Desulfosarcina sp.]